MSYPVKHLQLANWVRYLDYMETHGPEALGATVIVYERCLVACASYPGGLRLLEGAQ